MKVGVVMGSVSDADKLQPLTEFLEQMGVSYELRALSAHRAPAQLAAYLQASDADTALYIAAAGKAAHLPGVIASHTAKPVIGLPIHSQATAGMDALLSIVQMPPGIPVATVAIDGALNAGILACQMMAVGDSRLAEKVRAYRQRQTEKVLEKESEFLAKRAASAAKVQ